jgi:hypothetical protein
MSPEAALPTRRLEEGASIVQAKPWHTEPVSLDSAAVAVMTDLTQVKAATTGPSTLLHHAEQQMIYQGVRMLFVVTVRNLIATLKRHGRNHLLVVEGGGATPLRVRGVISRAQIERQLGTPIELVEVAGSFAELRQMLS